MLVLGAFLVVIGLTASGQALLVTADTSTTLLNATVGWWWADPLAGLAMVPIIVREGVEAVRGRSECEDCC